MQLDSYIHTHKGEQSQVDLSNYYDGLHLINIHSIYLFNNFYNFDLSLCDLKFYYEIASFINIPPGNYNLDSFNKYLLTTAAALYRVVTSYDGLSY